MAVPLPGATKERKVVWPERASSHSYYHPLRFW